MKPLPSFALVPCLLSSFAAISAQHARTPRPNLGQREAFDAPRLLTALTEGTPNGGVELTGDVDGDGDVDLLAVVHENAGISPHALQVWRNDGAAVFVHVYTLFFDVHFGNAVRYPRFLELTDVTGDGVLDILAVRERISPSSFPPDGLPSSVMVHPGNGDGSFAPELLIPGEVGDLGSTMSFAVGDCDGDGDRDVLVRSTYSDTVAWWTFDGATFVAGETLAGALISRLEAIDIGVDGIADAVRLSTGRDAVQVLRTVGGVPTFEDVVPLVQFPVDSRLHIGDLDGDGDEDVLAIKSVFPPSPTVSYFQPIWNGVHGLSLGVLQTGEYISNPSLGRLADWDGDGDDDFVTQSRWLINDGDGTFALAGAVTNESAQSLVHVTDVNGDGHMDACSGLTCYFGDGTFPRRNSTGDELRFTGGQPPSRFHALEDWEGDGDLDFVTCNELYLNNGDGTLVERAAARPSLPYPHDHFDDAAWGDFDGDGYRDLVAESHGFLSGFLRMVLLEGTASGAYVLSATVPSSIEMNVVESLSADLDGDGDVDILTRDGFWPNDGVGHFGTALVAAYSGRPESALDLEGDGDVDLLVHDGTGTTMRWLKNLGGLTFEESVLGSFASAPSYLDVDEDGDLDLVMPYPDTDVLRVWEQLPGGDFAVPIELAMPGASGPVGQVDVDRDGRLDLIVGGSGALVQLVETTHLLSAWMRDEGVSFSGRRDWVVLTSVDLLGFADVERDGDVDPLWFGPTTVRVFENMRFDGTADGLGVQYGLDAATSGAGGIAPVLGLGGPARPGQPAPLVIGRGRGGAFGLLLAGEERADFVSGGIRNLVLSPVVRRTFVLDGAPGAAGQGSLVLNVPVIPALIGHTRTLQVVLVDPDAASGLSATNGLEVRFGRL